MSGQHGAGLLAGKVLFVGGVGPQIGSATARVAAREGAKVALASRSSTTAHETAAAIVQAGGEALAVRCDLGVDEEVRAAVDTTVAALGPIDAVFYNAGVFDHEHQSLEIDPLLWETTMRVNLGGPMTLTRLTLPSMVERGGGAFVYNSSDAALAAEDVRVGYGISKAGLNAFTRFVASRYGREGIRANAILPFVAGGALGAKVATLNCLGRSGTADEVAEVVVFLCSDLSSIITGEIIHLDGGLFSRASWPSTVAPREPPPARPGDPGVSTYRRS
jgi:NAD(P)-dependent dehydrogenase (short-subunit alcohol dehydrogenase family)